MSDDNILDSFDFSYNPQYPGVLYCDDNMENNPQYPGVNNCGFNFNDASGATSNDKTLVEQEYEDMINSYGITIKYFVHNYDKYNSANNLVGTDLTKDYNYPVKLKMYIYNNLFICFSKKIYKIKNENSEEIKYLGEDSYDKLSGEKKDSIINFCFYFGLQS